MQLHRQFFCEALLACAASAPLTLVHAQSAPGGPLPGMDEVHSVHAMRGMHGMGYMAHPGMGHAGMGHPDMGQPGMTILHGMDLDDAQSDQIFLIMHEQAPQLRAIQKARTRAERDLDTLARSGQYSDADARPMVDAIAKSAADTAYLHARAQSRIVALLRPDQRAGIVRPGTRAVIRPAPDTVAPR